MTERTPVSTDGTKLGVRHRGSGAPLVLVHGTTGGIDTFALVEDQLAQHHTVWVYDRRGRGSSDDTEPYSLDREIDDLHVVLDAAGPGTHLVGHSFGAVCALAAASTRTDLRSLVLYEPPLHLDRADPAVLRAAFDRVDAGDFEGGLVAFCSVAGITAQEVAAMRTIPSVWAAMLDGVRRAPRELAALASTGWEPVATATLLLCGETTEAPVYLAPHELPTAETAVLAGQGHLAFGFDPTAFVEAVLDHTKQS